jgi:hypothetical protein
MRMFVLLDCDRRPTVRNCAYLILRSARTEKLEIDGDLLRRAAQ